jgi:glutathione peroxidase
MSDFFSLNASTPAGQSLPLSQYQGKVVLVVNTATQCGFTPQFKGLEALHQKYKGQGLAVIGFPCNQFDGQEPLSDAEMVDVCRRDHGVTFPLTAKIEVNGPAAHPVYQFLKKQTGGADIEWNFAKFLVTPDTIQRFTPDTVPEALVSEIEAALLEI